MSRRSMIQALWGEHRFALQAFFRRRATSSRDAADLTQEVYLRLLRAGDERQIANPEAYLFTVARNLLTEHAVAERKQAQGLKLRDSLLTSEPGHDPDIDRDIDHETQVRALREAIEQLPDPQKAALIMAFQQEMSYSQIAKKLNVHRSMVGKYVLQALSACRRRLKREGGA